MKKALLAFALCIFALSALQAQQPGQKHNDRLLSPSDTRWLLFNNLDKYKNFVDSAYVNYMLDNEAYSARFASEPFSDATFTKYSNLKDIQAIIIPLGDASLKETKGSSRSILQVVRDFIKAGKKVLITSRLGLALAFEASPDAEVQKFLTDTLGINYKGTLDVSKTSFVIRGTKEDPIGGNIPKYCNQSWVNGSDKWDPLAYYNILTVFDSKDPGKFFPTDNFMIMHDDPVTDKKVGIRAEWGDARIAFWSIGFEAFAGDNPRSTLLYRAMDWLTQNIPIDGPMIQLSEENIDFGHIKLNTKVEKQLQIKNVGNEPLIITETSFFGNDDDVFSITKGAIKPTGTPVTLKTDETYELTIAFTPKEKKEYAGSIDIMTNSIDGNDKNFNLSGFGGEEEISGPKVSFNFPNNTIDLGTIKPGEIKNFDIVIADSGANELEINTFKITDNTDDVFSFPQVVQVPFYVKPGESKTVKFRFGGSLTEKVYTGKIHVVTNDPSNGDFYVDLKAEVKNEVGVNDLADAKPGLRVSPNPVTDKCRIDCNLGTRSGKVEISLIDMNGNMVKSIYSGYASGEISTELSTSGISAGAYFISVRTGTSESRTKVIITK